MGITEQIEEAKRSDSLLLLVFYADWSPHYEWTHVLWVCKQFHMSFPMRIFVQDAFDNSHTAIWCRIIYEQILHILKTHPEQRPATA